MLYDLTEEEIRHIEKYRALTYIGRRDVDIFIERFAPLDDEMNREYCERKEAENK